MTQLGLVGDIGGTNARFALVRVGAGGGVALGETHRHPAAGFESFEALIGAAATEFGHPVVDFAAVACAGPVARGQVAFTNLPWSASEVELAAALNVKRALLLNDLAAMAWSTPLLGSEDLHEIKPGAPDANGPVALFNIGTGTNASSYVATPNGGAAVLVGEAGHASFAPTTEAEWRLHQALAARFGRVSIERLASGPGLLNIYQALAEMAGEAAKHSSSAEILASAGTDLLAGRALAAFISVLGGAAGDVALTFGATGGLYLCGGMAQALAELLTGEAFRRAFEAKGRFAGYMTAIPVRAILHPFAALIGAARAAV